MCISSIFISNFTSQAVSISSCIKIVSGKNPVFWDVMSHSLLKIYQCFISIDFCQIPTKIYSVTFQNTVFFIVTAMETLDLTRSQYHSKGFIIRMLQCITLSFCPKSLISIVQKSCPILKFRISLLFKMSYSCYNLKHCYNHISVM